MDYIKLQVGQMLKYKDWCKIIGVKPTNGKGRTFHIAKLNRYYKTHKEGQNFVIDEVYDTPLVKEDKRKYNGGNNTGRRKNFSQYQVSKEDDKAKGVYKISIDNNIYIGSTIYGFRKRFLQHINTNKIPQTQNMLKYGGIFEIIWKSQNNEDEITIREKENEYIKNYKSNNKYNVVNFNKAWCYKSNNIKNKFVTLKINSINYNKAIEILKQHNLLPNEI